jgi:predicted DNA-binding WGR domain protein
MTTFREFLAGRLQAGGFSTEDALASFLPLLRQVVATHDSGFVAPLRGLEALEVDGVRLFYDGGRCQSPSHEDARIARLEIANQRAVEVISESRLTLEIEKGRETAINLQIALPGQEINRPLYLPGYVSWEQEIGHHDPLTDTFVLGLILASLTCGLDLDKRDDLARFVECRSNLFGINPHLHPVLAKAVRRMTELNRHRRPQDLAALLGTLENYRDQDIDFEYELARNVEFGQANESSKRRTILSALQQRLFEISRRNRLLHFRQTMQSVNLSVASVPLCFDPASIRPEQILTWKGEFRDSIVAGKAISLTKHLRFEEALYLPGLLDHIRIEARRDQVEFGFAQLRLVIAFLRWSNLKEKPPERFDSPLVLLPVRLVKKKGVRDTFSLEPLSTEAEVNPILRHYFKQLYDVALPETLELSADSLDRFHEFLASQVQVSEPAVSVHKIDRPRIRLIHAKAQRRLDQYIQRTRSAVRKFGELDYSYEKENFRPLGLRLFYELIRRHATRLEGIINEPPRTRTLMAPEVEAPGPVSAKEKNFYTMEENQETNPYTWEYDLCNVTLGNFRYRKMSLVRDYAALLEGDGGNAAFDDIFSLQPRRVDDGPYELPPLEDRFPVLTCDPTQMSAIARARGGESYIIQGPPGTGKSQTIANLIADHVSRGQRVLFVCEKRAAIDVVYHRLRQQGLESLCALIHDSQEDKKALIMDLKQTYESHLERGARHTGSPEKERETVVRSLETGLGALRHFHEVMSSCPDQAGAPLRQVLERLITLRAELPQLSAVDKERMPPYGQWCLHRDRIARLVSALVEIQGSPVFAKHPLRHLSPRLAAIARPLEVITTHLEKALTLVDSLEEELAKSGLERNECDTLEKLGQLVRHAEAIHLLAKRKLVSLLERGSDSSKNLARLLKKYRARVKALDLAREATKGWREKLPADEVVRALELARGFENRSLSFLKPSWWRLRATLGRCYDFRSHRIKLTWTQILGNLARECDALARMDELQKNAEKLFHCTETVGEFLAKVQELRQASAQAPAFVQALQRRLLAAGKANATWLRVAELKVTLDELRGELLSFFDGFDAQSLADLKDELAGVEEYLDDVPEFIPCLAEAAGLPEELLGVLRGLPLGASELEAAMAARTWDDVCRRDRTFHRFTAQVRARHVNRLEELQRQFQQINSAVVCERVRQRFLERVRLSGLSHSQPTTEQKELKTIYNRGRRELEHEFGKTMRYRSIRDLVAQDTGVVIQDLKPVWLMSPLSVSDTLPLDAAHFDVVIFDEASQVTLEEAVPSIFRAPKTIVVGDQMQLPPTNFFSARHAEADDPLLVEDEATGEKLEYDLESNSFLAHAARALPSTMLGWHYRSRSESLISYSNAAFYHGELLTVPEKSIPAPGCTEVNVADVDEGDANSDTLRERPISFHFMKQGVYRNRRNATEADYIAHLVRGLLLRENPPSIGVIAFSEAQQGEIEAALNRLGQEDALFLERLEMNLEREENGQFMGLLVKNLENIQGDERDVIILSVCYGPDANGKMLMNFGPINQSGGEKRLNVAFSRAKEHMVVVSSIHYSQITNDYNDGARCLKNYLRYAQAISVGNLEAAGRTLRESLARSETSATEAASAKNVVVMQLADALRQRGYIVDMDVGQSSFRCNLAVRRPADQSYRAAILCDTEAYYAQKDDLERDVMRPLLLESFGWRVKHVLAKDWYGNQAAVLESVIRLIEDGSDSPEPIPESEADPSEPENGALTKDEPSAHTEHGAGSSVQSMPISESVGGERVFASAAESSWTRSFQFDGGTSHKFWEITLAGREHTVRFGRIGTTGQQRKKVFINSAEAEKDARRLINEKLAKGYMEAKFERHQPEA